MTIEELQAAAHEELKADIDELNRLFEAEMGPIYEEFDAVFAEIQEECQLPTNSRRTPEKREKK
jgi:hypothetical protein